jgi:hypothetical protein
MVASFADEGDIAIGAPELLMVAHETRLVFEEFGAATYEVAPNGEIVVLEFDTDDKRSALLVQNWPKLLENSQ